MSASRERANSPPSSILHDYRTCLSKFIRSPRNKQAAHSAGVTKVCIPALGKLSAAQRAEQHQRWLRCGQRLRAGCEGRISVMKRRDGLARCLYRGPDGMQRWVGWGVVSNNLWVLITADRPQRKQLP